MKLRKENSINFTVSQIILEIADYTVLLGINEISNVCFKHFYKYEVSNSFIFSLPLLYMIIMAYSHIYTRRENFWDETKNIIKSIVITIFIIIWLVLFLELRVNFLYYVLFTGILSMFFVPLFKYIVKVKLYDIGLWREPTIFVGAGYVAKQASKAFVGDKYVGYYVLGYLDDKYEQGLREIEVIGKKKRVLGSIKDIKKIVKYLKVGTVVIAIPSLGEEKLSKLTNEIQKIVKNTIIIPELKNFPLLNTMLYYLFFENLFLLYFNNNFKSLINRALKLSLDIFLSVILLPFLLPILLILSILIKLDSKGPIFYKQKRVGKDGKEFYIYKFRSMYVDADERLANLLSEKEEMRKEWETNFKLKNDPRVTRIGKLLRRTSLDELPQVINVLKGEMSFIGPRPVTKKEIELYYKEHKQYYCMVKPGITGLWQVSGRSNLDYNTRVRLDVMYVLNWSLWLDITILLKTFNAVFKKEGAY